MPARRKNDQAQRTTMNSTTEVLRNNAETNRHTSRLRMSLAGIKAPNRLNVRAEGPRKGKDNDNHPTGYKGSTPRRIAMYPRYKSCNPIMLNQKPEMATTP